ncbi:MAG: hypothetical protein EA368_13810 [Leptolyngbya sp. DLM2.Bin27]|nr:MAG: hypothetical protein EA368_13810 [Leptolyngbya sp. DLM2.Bin27]
MATTPDREPTLSDIAQQLSELRDELDSVKRNQELAQKSQEQGQQWQERFQQQGQQWQDRTWDVIKWAGGISAGLAISASIALVGIVIQPLGQ